MYEESLRDQICLAHGFYRPWGVHLELELESFGWGFHKMTSAQKGKGMVTKKNTSNVSASSI